MERPSRGRVVVDGTDIAALDERGLREARRSIGMIFQHFNLLSSRTAFDNIALPLEIAGLDRLAIRKRVEPLLEMVGLSDKRASTLPTTASLPRCAEPRSGCRGRQCGR